MKKFEFNFTNEWRSAAYGFDFIKIGWFADTDWTDSYDYFDLSITLLGFNFSFTWNSGDYVACENELSELLMAIKENREEALGTILFDIDELEVGQPKKAKKTSKKVAKKAVKKAVKKTKKSK